MLRPYQCDALGAIKKEYRNGVKAQLVQAATGLGKTVIAAHIPEYMGGILPGKLLFLAHREELLDQTIDKFKKYNPKLRISKEMAEYHAAADSEVVVASVATLGRAGTERINKFNWNDFDKIITDECQHSPASSYRNIYNSLGLFSENSKKLHVGFTATPQRSDGKALAEVFQKIVYSYGIRAAIEDGWLVDVRGIRVDTQTNLDKVHIVSGDFAQDELANAVNNPARNRLVTKAWLDNADNRQTIVFTVDIQHAVDLAQMFKQYNVKAEAIWGNDPERQDSWICSNCGTRAYTFSDGKICHRKVGYEDEGPRECGGIFKFVKGKLNRHKDREITVLTNCGVLTEGYDDWRVGCIVLARPTKSNTLFTQMIGRGTRLEEGMGNLKEQLGNVQSYGGVIIKQDCLVIDVVDISSKHSLVTLPTLLGMSKDLSLHGGSLVGAIQKLEEAQKEYSHIDFSNLTDIDKLQSFITSVNLFDVKFPEVVESNSDLSWHGAADGGFILLLPWQKDEQGKGIRGTGGEVKIYQNLLDKWEITANIKGKRGHGVRETIEEAFVAADEIIYSQAGDSLKILRRHEKWHSEAATVKQLMILRKFYRGKALPDSLTKGQASQLISSFLAKKAK